MELEYRSRINRVVRYIEEHLDSPLTVEKLADISSFSFHHFHRVFKRIMNENVIHFVNRLRVEKAVKVIVFEPERSLTDIALECGLQSPAHFSRTFRRYTGLSPTEYRVEYSIEKYVRWQEARLSEENGSIRLPEVEEKYRSLKIEVRQLPKRCGACIHHVGTLIREVSDQTVSEEFGRLEAWMQAHDLMEADTQAIGVIFDDPCITPESKQRYTVCFTTSRTIPPSLEVLPITLPEGKYAVMSVAEPIDVLNELMHMVTIRWLQLSPYQWDEDRCMMTIFQGAPLQDPEGLVRIEFCIPVKLK
ncbi:AraC family transcriptional regulator [Paenibacillus methanolicus]|uniref:AraC family transcriptional regulator n=1 Tax=Paenibacillus methanolicus TaxID=582686 RepID=A0A5S5CIQ0_9BACL|nr:AraC family transcriptional regulator [Paenibacillus methanolicus]TYP79404.1 AraC family transcriptional regulator [Paenibacillus methanolicus]